MPQSPAATDLPFGKVTYQVRCLPINPENVPRHLHPTKPLTDQIEEWEFKFAVGNEGDEGQVAREPYPVYQETTAYPTHRGCFSTAILAAYNGHLDLVISPDDLVSMHLLFLSDKVAMAPEFYRPIFVNHQGKEKLVVKDPGPMDESAWSPFLDQITAAMQPFMTEHARYMCRAYSTTTPSHARAHAAQAMGAMKAYFEYGRMMCMCGIRNLLVMGQVQDYTDLKAGLVKLQDMLDGLEPAYLEAEANHVPSPWDGLMGISDFLKLKKSYPPLRRHVRALITLADKIAIGLETGDPDAGWWNRVFNMIQEIRSSGGSEGYRSRGWLNELYGFEASSAVHFDSLILGASDAQVKLSQEDAATGEPIFVRNCRVASAFIGYTCHGDAVRPHVAISVWNELEAGAPPPKKRNSLPCYRFRDLEEVNPEKDDY